MKKIKGLTIVSIKKIFLLGLVIFTLTGCVPEIKYNKNQKYTNNDDISSIIKNVEPFYFSKIIDNHTVEFINNPPKYEIRDWLFNIRDDFHKLCSAKNGKLESTHNIVYFLETCNIKDKKISLVYPYTSYYDRKNIKQAKVKFYINEVPNKVKEINLEVKNYQDKAENKIKDILKNINKTKYQSIDTTSTKIDGLHYVYINSTQKYNDYSSKITFDFQSAFTNFSSKSYLGKKNINEVIRIITERYTLDFDNTNNMYVLDDLVSYHNIDFTKRRGSISFKLDQKLKNHVYKVFFGITNISNHNNQPFKACYNRNNGIVNYQATEIFRNNEKDIEKYINIFCLKEHKYKAEGLTQLIVYDYTDEKIVFFAYVPFEVNLNSWIQKK